MKMLGKKMELVKKLSKKVKVIGRSCRRMSTYERLSSDHNDISLSITPNGFFPVYVGEERHRFVVPTSYLCHPLFRMLLEKTQDRFGFGQRNGLLVPCSVAAFEELLSAAECSHGHFDLENFLEEFM